MPTIYLTGEISRYISAFDVGSIACQFEEQDKLRKLQ